MGFDLTRQSIAVPEPWAEYADPQTGYFWAGWQAAERDMLERAIAKFGGKVMTDNTELIARLRAAVHNSAHPLMMEAADALEAAQPAPQVPMPDEDILADKTLRYYFGLNGGDGPVSDKGLRIVRAIEAHHKIGVKP